MINFGFLAPFLPTMGIPLVVVGVVMAFVGLMKWWTRGVWAITVGLVAVPAYTPLGTVLEAVYSSGPRCTPDEGTAEVTLVSEPGETSVSCSPPIPKGFVGVIAPSGPAVRVFMLARDSS